MERSGSRDPAPERWFLAPDERGNPATGIDRRRGDGRAWTEGNAVVPLPHGATYFARLHAEIERLRPGDHLWLLDWRGDADERLTGEPGSELGAVLSDAARRGVDVRGLVWRSHPDQEKFSEQENLHLGEVLNRAGGQILLDERVRRFGSHHQKLVLVGHPGREEEDVAFVGGIDLCHGRRDDERHAGDPQPMVLDRRYGPTPAWHDAQLEIRGPAVGDLVETFRERWTDPTPLDHRNPWRTRLARRADQPRRPGPLPSPPPDPPPTGNVSVQVLRTYPAKRPPFPFAPRGERSVARAYVKALGPGLGEEESLHPAAGFEAWRRRAAALDAWHAGGCRGPRPGGRVRRHRPGAVPPPVSWLARPVYRLAIDPDGRPRDLRRTGRL